MSITRIAADIRPSVAKALRDTKFTQTGTSETFKNGTRLVSQDGGKVQTVYSKDGDILMVQRTNAKSQAKISDK